MLEFESKNKDGWFPLNNFPSYESADERKREIQQGKPSIYNYNISRIYLDDNKFCNPTAPTAIGDFKNRLNILYSSWQKSLATSLLKYNGYKIPSIPLATTREWKKMIDESTKKNEQMRLYNENFSETNLGDINEKMKVFQQEYSSFQTMSDSYIAKYTVQNNESNAWKSLPDGYSYKIEPNGYYTFFDGVDQIESLTPTDGPNELSKHQRVIAKENKNEGQSNQLNDNLVNDKDAIKNLQGLCDVLSAQLNELKKDGITPEVQELEKQVEKLRLEIKELQKD
ncbi:MAG: hypothetical protein IPH32_18755 [Bacteroidetes bacterium]|nr:hypothetical protein [Bacteroidota bacterium]